MTKSIQCRKKGPIPEKRSNSGKQVFKSISKNAQINTISTISKNAQINIHSPKKKKYPPQIVIVNTTKTHRQKNSQNPTKFLQIKIVNKTHSLSEPFITHAKFTTSLYTNLNICFSKHGVPPTIQTDPAALILG